jgi:hypothetical protein
MVAAATAASTNIPLSTRKQQSTRLENNPLLEEEKQLNHQSEMINPK